eukprot:TRINITY_DN14683_c0_g1_i1.p1 TRINITY_DN14683_c0_g1~~TRINITY_DN14683_c0_g1_i1.p1  ORF type:complete len:689 (+),score=227.99 TRINITY_DN14683_c0_g1_i1:115-2181(+)
MSQDIGVQIAKRLVRSGMKASKIRDRVRCVIAKKEEELGGRLEGKELRALAESEARTQLLNEAFSELRYRSLLMVMKNEMPLVPLQQNDKSLDECTIPALGRLPSFDPRPANPLREISTTLPAVTASPAELQSMPSPVPELTSQPPAPPAQRETMYVNREGRLSRLYTWWNKTQVQALETSEFHKGMKVLQEASKGGRATMTQDEMIKIASLTPLEVRFLVAKKVRKVTELFRTEGDIDQPYAALRLARESLAIMLNTHGAGHPLMLPVLNVYAFSCLQVKQFAHCELAVQILDRLFTTIDKEEEMVYPLDPLCYSPRRETAILLSIKMQLAYHKGQFQQAVDCALQALDAYDEVSDDETIAAAKDSVSLMLAVSLTMLGRNEEAEAQFKRSLVDLVDRHSTGSTAIVPNLQVMSAYAMNMKNYEDARTLAATAYKNLHSALGQHHPRTLSGMKQVAEMCLLTKQYKTAAKWLLVLNRMYIEYLTRFGAALSPVEHANSLHLLSLSFLGLHKPEEALQVSTHSLRLYEKTVSGGELEALREPLLTWCTAFRMCGCHAQLNGAKHVTTVLHRFLDIIKMPGLSQPAPSDVWYCLHHLAYYHLWLGNYAKAECAVYALETLNPPPQYSEIRPWLDDVERVRRAQYMGGTWPDKSNAFFYGLLLCFLADLAAGTFKKRDSEGDIQPEQHTE